MEVESQRPNGREGVIPALNVAIESMNPNPAKGVSSITPAKAVFGSVSVILTVNRVDYVELALACADVCTALDRGLSGKRSKDLNTFVCEAIKKLTTWVTPVPHLIDDAFGLIPGLSRIFKRSSSTVGGTHSLSFSTQRTTRKKSPPGGRASTGSFMSSTCVPSFPTHCYR